MFPTLISLSFTAFTAAEADIVTSGVCAVVTNESGDVDENGLDIVDVTLILRTLSDFEIPYEVGTKTLYTEI